MKKQLNCGRAAAGAIDTNGGNMRMLCEESAEGMRNIGVIEV
jgi:hypothetical protein